MKEIGIYNFGWNCRFPGTPWGPPDLHRTGECLQDYNPACPTRCSSWPASAGAALRRRRPLPASAGPRRPPPASAVLGRTSPASAGLRRPAPACASLCRFRPPSATLRRLGRPSPDLGRPWPGLRRPHLRRVVSVHAGGAFIGSLVRQRKSHTRKLCGSMWGAVARLSGGRACRRDPLINTQRTENTAVFHVCFGEEEKQLILASSGEGAEDWARSPELGVCYVAQ